MRFGLVPSIVTLLGCASAGAPRPEPPGIARPRTTAAAAHDQLVVVTEPLAVPAAAPQETPPAAPPPTEPPAVPPATDGAPPAAAAPPPTKPVDLVDDERVRNEAIYENDYLRQKERLFADHAGEWVAIAGGRLLPADAKGRVAPAKSLDDCLRAVESAVPVAPQRFVFRIGEEGDVIYGDSVAEPRSVIGTSFKASLGIAARFDPSTSSIVWTRGAHVHRFMLDREQIELLLADPSGRTSLGAHLSDSSGFGGWLLLEATPADLLDAEKNEIPGRVLLKAAGAVQELRRARVRVKIADLDLSEVVPVAVWPK